MQMFSLSQYVFLIASLGSAGIYLVALVCVVAWPQVRSRGLFLAALGLKCAVACIYLVLRAVQMFGFGGIRGSGIEMLGFAYMGVAMIGLAADATLAAALLNLGHVFRLMQRNAEAKMSPAGAPPRS